MNESLDRQVWIAFGILALLTVIGIIVLAFNTFSSTVTEGASEMNQVGDSMLNNYYSSYDLTQVKGLDVIKAIETYGDLAVVVRNGSSNYYYNKGVNITTNPGISTIIVDGNPQQQEITRAIGDYSVQTLSSANNYSNKKDGAYISSYTNYNAYIITDQTKENVIGFLFASK